MKKRLYISSDEAEFFANNRMLCSDNPPTQGDFIVGDIVISSKQTDEIFGWVCVEAGSPGQWEIIGDTSVIESAIKELEEHNKTVESNINVLKNKLNELKEQAIEAGNNQTEAIDRLNDKVVTNTTNILNINKNIEDIINNATESTGQINQDITVINNNVQKNTENINTIQNQVTENVKDIEVLENQVGENVGNIGSLMDQVTEHDESIKGLNEQVTENTENINGLQNDVLGNDTEIKQLENKVIVLQESDSNLDLSIFATKDTLNEINKQIETIKYNIEEIENANEQNDEDIELLTNKINVIEDNVQDVYETINDTVVDIKNDIMTNKSNISTLNTHINTLNKKLTNIEQLVENDMQSLSDLRSSFATALRGKGVAVNLNSDWNTLFERLMDLIELGWCTDKDETGAITACTSISISGFSSTNMNVGSTQSITATASPANCGFTPTITSSNPNIIKISSVSSPKSNTTTCTLTAVGPGSCIITASAGDKSDRLVITVTANCEALTISSNSQSIELGSSILLTANPSPSNCTDVITWSSTTTTVATVTNNGYVTAIGVGETVIVATCGNKTARCTIEVSAPCTGIKINASQLIIEKGLEHTLIATVYPSSCTEDIVWKSSNETIVSVDSNGVITGISAGQCNVTATCGKYTSTCVVTVQIKTVAIALNDTNITLTKDTSKQLGYTLTPEDSTEAITWSSSDNSVATVNNGLVKAIKGGSCTISATSGTYASKCIVTVNSPCKGLSFASASCSFNANGTYDMNSFLVVTPSDCTDNISWYIDNYNLGSITSDGKLTLVDGSGTFYVQAQCGGYVATVTIYFK